MVYKLHKICYEGENKARRVKKRCRGEPDWIRSGKAGEKSVNRAVQLIERTCRENQISIETLQSGNRKFFDTKRSIQETYLLAD